MIELKQNLEVETTIWMEPGPHLTMEEAQKLLHATGTRILERDDENRKFLVLKEVS